MTTAFELIDTLAIKHRPGGRRSAAIATYLAWSVYEGVSYERSKGLYSRRGLDHGLRQIAVEVASAQYSPLDGHYGVILDASSTDALQNRRGVGEKLASCCQRVREPRIDVAHCVCRPDSGSESAFENP